jgi:hypothetical protein
MKIKNKSKEHVKIKMEDGKIYDFPPGQIRTVRKELAEEIIKRDKKTFKKVEN